MMIEHIAMYVRELETAKDFFVKYFHARTNEGYHNPVTGLRSYFLSFEGGARLGLMNRPEMSETRGEMGYAHLAFRVGSRAAVDALTERLRQDGFAILSGPRMTGDGYYESCILGIEGNTIEIAE